MHNLLVTILTSHCVKKIWPIKFYCCYYWYAAGGGGSDDSSDYNFSLCPRMKYIFAKVNTWKLSSLYWATVYLVFIKSNILLSLSTSMLLLIFVNQISPNFQCILGTFFFFCAYVYINLFVICNFYHYMISLFIPLDFILKFQPVWCDYGQFCFLFAFACCPFEFIFILFCF